MLALSKVYFSFVLLTLYLTTLPILRILLGCRVLLQQTSDWLITTHIGFVGLGSFRTAGCAFTWRGFKEQGGWLVSRTATNKVVDTAECSTKYDEIKGRNGEIYAFKIGMNKANVPNNIFSLENNLLSESNNRFPNCATHSLSCFSSISLASAMTVSSETLKLFECPENSCNDDSFVCKLTCVKFINGAWYCNSINLQWQLGNPWKYL